jgi:hypothetical protein
LAYNSTLFYRVDKVWVRSLFFRLPTQRETERGGGEGKGVQYASANSHRIKFTHIFNLSIFTIQRLRLKTYGDVSLASVYRGPLPSPSPLPSILCIFFSKEVFLGKI